MRLVLILSSNSQQKGEFSYFPKILNYSFNPHLQASKRLHILEMKSIVMVSGWTKVHIFLMQNILNTYKVSQEKQ